MVYDGKMFFFSLARYDDHYFVNMLKPLQNNCFGQHHWIWFCLLLHAKQSINNCKKELRGHVCGVALASCVLVTLWLFSSGHVI